MLRGRFTFPGAFAKGAGRVAIRSGALAHSGGTAPDSHRTSLLCPRTGHPERPELYQLRLAENRNAASIDEHDARTV